jgi:energy-coupling factor transport system ATP-binding protein
MNLYLGGEFMNNIISIDNLTFSYDEEFVLYNFNLSIKNNEWVTIAGPNASGKSTLVKILCGLLKSDGNIIIDNMALNDINIKNIRKRMGIVFDNPDNTFICETVFDEIALILKNLNYSDIEIETKVYEVSKLFKLDDILGLNAHNLSGGEKQRVAIACSLVHNPKILILDVALCMIDSKSRNEILDILRNIKEKKNITIINITHNLDESFYSDRLVVVNKGEIILNGPVKKVLSYDRILNRIGVEIPFIVDLSIKLKLYGLIDDLFFNMDELVNTLWK